MYYEYKEWGNTVAVILLNNTDEERELANANPLRYRGYYLDSETGYYYLQSRYYDSSICRFINADVASIAQQYKFDVNGLNIFVYCCAVLFFDWNNPKEPKGINHAALSGQMINSAKYYDMYYYAHTSDRNGKQYLNGKRQYTSIKDVYNNNYYKNMIVKVCVLR